MRTLPSQDVVTSTARGRLDALEAEAARRGRAWVHGKGVSRRLKAA